MAFLGNCVSLSCASLRSVLLHAGLVSSYLVEAFLLWLDSCLVNLWVTATAFFAEVRQGVGKEGFGGLLPRYCCLGCLFLWEDPWQKGPWTGVARAGIRSP